MSAPVVRWGVLGAAGIAANSFLPGLREAGGGRAVVVGARDGARGEAWAADNGVERAVAGYDAVVDSPDVDVVYVALPNGLHAPWTVRALEAGKAVLCEKPLCGDADETRRVLATAARSASPLWEAFVFPFAAQQRRLQQLIADGAIGEIREVQSSFHFALDRPDDIRMSADLAGGALADVGCYPVHFGHQILTPPPSPPAVVGATTVEAGVDVDAAGVVTYATGRLVMSCGFRLAKLTEAQLLGTDGRIHLSNPFHPRPTDTLTILRSSADPVVERPTVDRYSFAPALRHIHEVLGGGAQPQDLAVATAQLTADVLQAIRELGRRAPSAR